MNNSLQQSKIRENCMLSLPDGLKDLMSDISREVLRAQPQNVYQFIANYLQALLEVRDALSIAQHICDEMCGCTCETELQNELKTIGLDEEDVTKAVDIIQEHFKSGAVNEPSLFVKLVKKTSIDEFYIPAIQEAIQNAFKRQQLKNVKAKFLQSNDYDETTKAVQHTIHISETSKPKTEEIFVSTHVEPCENVSLTFIAGYQEMCEFKHEPCDSANPSEISKEQLSKLSSTHNDIDKEFEKIKDGKNINSELIDEKIIENYISDNDNKIEHPEYNIDDFDNVKNEDFIGEEIVENGESSGNISIVSSVDESLRNSDNSDEEIF